MPKHIAWTSIAVAISLQDFIFHTNKGTDPGFRAIITVWSMPCNLKSWGWTTKSTKPGLAILLSMPRYYRCHMWPPLAARMVRTWQSMLFTRTLSLPMPTAYHVWPTACHRSATAEDGLSMSLIRIDFWPHTCSKGFMSGLRTGQSITSTLGCSRKAVVLHVVCCGSLPWTNTVASKG